jgi:serine protease Do
MPRHSNSAEPGFRRFALVAAGLLLFLAGIPTTFAVARGPESVADIAEGLQDAVVNISTTQTLKGSSDNAQEGGPKGSPFEEFFNDFFDDQGGEALSRKVSSLGSGFVIDPAGLIVTNNHVIEGADEILVNFTDGTSLKVTKILGHDPKTDLALLQVEPKKPLKAAAFGDSAKMRVGDWVMAIGNPFGLGGTVTVGVISATRRDINSGPYDDFLQTDAAINRGNSGGPLFNMDGQVIGVNTAIISPSGGSIGIGFAVPSNSAVQVVEQLKQYGETRRGWLGVHVQNITDEMAASLGLQEPKGALVAQVTPGSPAAAAGIQPSDVARTSPLSCCAREKSLICPWWSDACRKMRRARTPRRAKMRPRRSLRRNARICLASLLRP